MHRATALKSSARRSAALHETPVSVTGPASCTPSRTLFTGFAANKVACLVVAGDVRSQPHAVPFASPHYGANSAVSGPVGDATLLR